MSPQDIVVKFPHLLSKYIYILNELTGHKSRIYCTWLILHDSFSGKLSHSQSRGTVILMPLAHRNHWFHRNLESRIPIEISSNFYTADSFDGVATFDPSARGNVFLLKTYPRSQCSRVFLEELSGLAYLIWPFSRIVPSLPSFRWFLFTKPGT
jgi:hypothetical protein